MNRLELEGEIHAEIVEHYFPRPEDKMDLNKAVQQGMFIWREWHRLLGSFKGHSVKEFMQKHRIRLKLIQPPESLL